MEEAQNLKASAILVPVTLSCEVMFNDRYYNNLKSL